MCVCFKFPQYCADIYIRSIRLPIVPQIQFIFKISQIFIIIICPPTSCVTTTHQRHHLHGCPTPTQRFQSFSSIFFSEFCGQFFPAQFFGRGVSEISPAGGRFRVYELPLSGPGMYKKWVWRSGFF